MDHQGTGGRGESEGEGPVLVLSGRIDRTRVNALWREALGALRRGGSKRLVLDCSRVSAIDTAGVAFLESLEQLCATRGVRLALHDLPDGVAQFLDYLHEHASSQGQEPAERAPQGLLWRADAWGRDRLEDMRMLVRFIGDFSVAAATAILSPRRNLRVEEVFSLLQKVGAEAMPIVAALSGLMGMVMVFQGTTTIKNFGAPIYIADMVAIAVTREMAPLLTAVILAGRSGAAYAAEIGTMKINEQVDALAVMNFDIAGFLVLPRVFALMIAAPLLTILADAAGFAGGLLTSIWILGLPAVSFMDEIRRVLTAHDIVTGIIKGVTFGALIGLIGCFNGLKTELAANSVGIQTTSAVVAGILFTVIADAFFSAVFHLYGWW